MKLHVIPLAAILSLSHTYQEGRTIFRVTFCSWRWPLQNLGEWQHSS